MTLTLLQFLRESNNIEGVYDDLSFQDAILAWKYCFNESRITIPVILETHKILMKHQPLKRSEIGHFRTQPVYIGGREALHHLKIVEELGEWCSEIEIDVLGKRRLWKQRHIEYEQIHPFIDGNGRTGRIFMNWQRHRMNLPLLVIKNAEKRDYYQWFKQD